MIASQFQRAIHNGLGPDPESRIGKVVSVSLTALIVLNITALVLETVDEIQDLSPRGFGVFEAVSVVLFTIEYLLRVWSCVAEPRYSHPISGRLRFIASPLALVDLIAILPFYAVLLNLSELDLRVLRAARLMGRVASLGRYSSGLRTFGRVVQAKRTELVTVIMVLSLLLLLSSSMMYYAENNAQPDVFSSIPETMWWGIITLTTVGYGDVYPITALGRTLAGLMAVLGIGLFALPAGILGSGFIEEVQHRVGRGKTCPHCGEKIE